MSTNPSEFSLQHASEILKHSLINLSFVRLKVLYMERDIMSEGVRYWLRSNSPESVMAPLELSLEDMANDIPVTSQVLKHTDDHKAYKIEEQRLIIVRFADSVGRFKWYIEESLFFPQSTANEHVFVCSRCTLTELEGDKDFQKILRRSGVSGTFSAPFWKAVREWTAYSHNARARRNEDLETLLRECDAHLPKPVTEDVPLIAGHLD